VGKIISISLKPLSLPTALTPTESLVVPFVVHLLNIKKVYWQFEWILRYSNSFVMYVCSGSWHVTYILLSLHLVNTTTLTSSLKHYTDI
jgi:hypothetical protein